MNELDVAKRLFNAEYIVDTMKSKVLVISRHESLLGRAVEHIVTEEREWMVLRASDDDNVMDIVRKVDEAGPNIVVISQDEPANDERLSMLVLHECLTVKKVIIVSLNANEIEVFYKQRIQVKSPQDLFLEVERQFQIYE
ncbi:MAG TPA: hypothetical protein PLE14_03795 [Anaerolineales bacterium]|nr:hypothetical protein [Anaerolineales bacterium]HNO30632.1 hypothetical protein [Anaerolineales bacterium]